MISPVGQNIIANFYTNWIFSQGWETIQYSKLVKLWLPNSLISWLIVGPIQWVIIHTNELTMGTLSQWPRPIIPPIRRWCTTTSNGLPKSTNKLWTNHLLTRNFCVTPNAPKSCIIQEMLGQNACKV